jgi:hypothetical protein
MPEGKANKGMMDIWVGKHSMRRNGERTIVLYFITLGSITKSEPDSNLEQTCSKMENSCGIYRGVLASSIYP